MPEQSQPFKRLAWLPLAVCGLLQAADDEWALGNGADATEASGTPTVITLMGGACEGGDRYIAASLGAGLGRQLSVDLSASQTRLEDRDGFFTSLDLSGDLELRIDSHNRLGGGLRFQGQRGELEIERHRLGWTLNSGSLELALAWHFGRVTVFSRSDIDGRFNLPRSRSFDTDGWSLRLSTLGNDWGGYLSWERHDYDQDLSVLERHPLLQWLIEPGALQQTGLLLSERLGLGLSHYQERYSWSLGLSRQRNGVDGETSRDLSLDGQYTLNPSWQLLLGLGYGLDAEQPLSLSAGLQWYGG